jgi:hypothetical protein
MVSLTLLRQGSSLADPANQRHILADAPPCPFEQALADSGLWPLRAAGIRVLQVNVGKLCTRLAGTATLMRGRNGAR